MHNICSHVVSKKKTMFLVLLFCLLTSVSYAGEAEEGFFKAAETGNVSEVNRFLEQGVNVNAKDKDGNTALILALANDRQEVVNAIIEKGAEVNAKNFNDDTPLMLASRYGSLAGVKALLEKGAEVNAKTKSGMTAFLLASMEGRLDVVNTLLGNGADIGAKDDNGYTALMLASNHCHLDSVKLLLEKGVDINMKTKDLLQSALSLAAMSPGNKDVVKFLLDKGADIEIFHYTSVPGAIQTDAWVTPKTDDEVGKLLDNAIEIAKQKDEERKKGQ
jgi:ankyrin repeat protein